MTRLFKYIKSWIHKVRSLSQITVEGSELFVDGIFVTSVLGTDKSRDLFLKEGVAVVIEPKEDIFRITLENYGQRQAMLPKKVSVL